MPAPLATPFPLKGTPFYSRISDQLTSDPVKNYYAIAFNPGFPLQASELNELQEIFFINNTLSTMMCSSWQSITYNIPSWTGLIPLSPTSIQITNVQQILGTWSGDISIPLGWYLWGDPISKLRHWLYLDSNISGSISIPTGQTRYIGLTVTKENIKCCTSNECSDGEDSDIRDNSNGFPGNSLTCGASRLKATIGTSIDIRNSAPEGTDWSLLFKIDTTNDGINAYYNDEINLVPTTYTSTPS